MKIEEYVGMIGGIAEYSQLRASGFTTAAAQYAVRVGRLARIRRGWVATPDAPESSVRAVRVGGSLTCVSVLTERGVWCVDDELLHVRVNRHANHLASPDSRSVALGDPAMQGVAVHGTFAAYRSPRYCHTDPVDVAVMHSIDCQPRDYAIALCDSAINLELTTRLRLLNAAELIDKRHSEVVALSDGRAQSGLETKARLRLRALRIPYQPQAYIEAVGCVDLLIGDRLVLELDGREWHSSPEAFAEDRRRDLILHERGYFVVRLTYAQVMFEWPRVEGMIRELVVRHKHLWPRSVGAANSTSVGAQRHRLR
ncbi:MAG: hypothetical protein JWQ64_942 [Subtercola sp.]|nr:hypothetical protein [Subtercola sp.]